VDVTNVEALDDELESPPEVVTDLIEMARKMVGQVIGVEPDLTPETLPLCDQYLRTLPEDATDEVRSLVVSAVGCYFGEVARRTLSGRWALCEEGPRAWRIELEPCFLYFHPVGMAGEVMLGRESELHDGSFATLDELRDELFEMLAMAPPLPEGEYYSLAGRIEVLQIAADWLVGRRLASDKPVEPYSAEDYLELLGP
jgi:hypothetical protein